MRYNDNLIRDIMKISETIFDNHCKSSRMFGRKTKGDLLRTMFTLLP